MGSSDNRSLPGFSLPMWMKHKGGVDRYEFEDIVSSPPTNDENFFYLRYPQMSRQTPRQSMYSRINELVEESTHGAAASVVSDSSSPVLTSPSIEVTPPVEQATSIMGNTTTSVSSSSKVHSDSVVDVAQQMSKQMTIGPKVAKPETEKQDKPFSLLSHMAQSLPPTPCETPSVTPDSSPRISRKALPNPHHYFTGASISEKSNSNSGGGSSGGGWFFSGLLSTNSQQIATVEDASDVASAAKKQEAEFVEKKIIRRAESAQAVLQTESLVSVVQTAMTDTSDGGVKPVPSRMRPKPTELREINFWSPTSM